MQKLKILMAPMQGFTEAPFRNVFSKVFGGVDEYLTPFIRWERGGVRKKDMREIEPSNNECGILVPQIIASSAEEAELILPFVIEKGYNKIDINMGCSFPVISKKQKGSGILPFPDKVADLLSVTDKHKEVEFSVKMRLGYETPEECMSLISILNESRLRRITMHARVGKQQYKGDCDIETFKRFASECKHPLVYNGDIISVDDIKRIQAEIPAIEGVMIGRGLLSNPWLASEYINDNDWSADQKRNGMKKLHNDLYSYYEQQLEGGEKQLLDKMKPFWEYFMPDADRKLHKKIHKSQKISDYINSVSRILNF